MEGGKDPEAAPDTDPGELDGESGKTMQNATSKNKERQSLARKIESLGWSLSVCVF
jgi:hypothetical protein